VTRVAKGVHRYYGRSAPSACTCFMPQPQPSTRHLSGSSSTSRHRYPQVGPFVRTSAASSLDQCCSAHHSRWCSRKAHSLTMVRAPPTDAEAGCRRSPNLV